MFGGTQPPSERSKILETIPKWGQRPDSDGLQLDARFQSASYPKATTCRDIADAMQRLLTERERRFLRAYFGFDKGQKAALEEVGGAEGSRQ
jgi:hypothetical protein